MDDSSLVLLQDHNMLVINERGRDGKALLVLRHRVKLRDLRFLTHFSLICCSWGLLHVLLPAFPVSVKGGITTCHGLVIGMLPPELSPAGPPSL